ncbi:MAG TPA: peptide deformylase [Halanaerobiales bacterium]|nr:peptide deformylase [Halanaerobiales bacterium]
MAIMNIRKIGDPVLRSKAKEVEKISQKTIDLIENMSNTMYEADGIGLAAPQVGVLQRLFIVDIGNGLIEVINPKIIEENGQTIMEEGCLSIPDETGAVVRAKEIVMEGYNKEGKKIKIEADGLLARALQHEYDHLEGNLFTDRVIDEEKLEKEINE